MKHNIGFKIPEVGGFRFMFIPKVNFIIRITALGTPNAYPVREIKRYPTEVWGEAINKMDFFRDHAKSFHRWVKSCSVAPQGSDRRRGEIRARQAAGERHVYDTLISKNAHKSTLRSDGKRDRRFVHRKAAERHFERSIGKRSFLRTFLEYQHMRATS